MQPGIKQSSLLNAVSSLLPCFSFRSCTRSDITASRTFKFRIRKFNWIYQLVVMMLTH